MALRRIKEYDHLEEWDLFSGTKFYFILFLFFFPFKVK